MTAMMMMTRLMTNRTISIKTHSEHHADLIFETSMRLLAGSTRLVHYCDASSASPAVIMISVSTHLLHLN